MISEILILRGLTVLADGDPRGVGSVEELRVNGTAVLDVEGFIFATRPTIFDRGMRTGTVSFSLYRSAGSLAEALDRHLRGPSASLGVEDLTISLIEDGVRYSWTTTAAGWQQGASDELGGVSGRIAMQVLCAPFGAAETTVVEDGGDGALPANEAAGDLDGGDDNLGVAPTDDWNCLSEGDDEGAVVLAFDGGADA